MMRPWRVQYSSDGQSFIEETPDNVDDEGRLVAHLFELDEPGRDRRLADLIVSAVNARLVVGADVAKLRALLAAAVLDARRLPLTVVLEDGANPEGGYSWNLGDCRGAFVCGSMSRTEAEAIAAAVNQAIPLLDELEALRAERDRLKDIVSATSCSLELVAEARDEGHAAGRKEALYLARLSVHGLAAPDGGTFPPGSVELYDHVLQFLRSCGLGSAIDGTRISEAEATRALAGKL